MRGASFKILRGTSNLAEPGGGRWRKGVQGAFFKVLRDS